MSKKNRFANRRGVRNKTGIATEELDQARKLKIIIYGYQFMGTIFSHIRVPNPQISDPRILDFIEILSDFLRFRC